MNAQAAGRATPRRSGMPILHDQLARGQRLPVEVAVYRQPQLGLPHPVELEEAGIAPDVETGFSSLSA